jgi:Tfp pilus assembly protein FimT
MNKANDTTNLGTTRRRSRLTEGRERGFSLVEIMTVATIGIVLSAFAITKMSASLQNFRTGGNARSVTTAVALAKMRASSGFTHARVYANLSAQTVEVDVWNTSTSAWAPDSQNGTAQSLSSGVTFGYGASIASPPPRPGRSRPTVM